MYSISRVRVLTCMSVLFGLCTFGGCEEGEELSKSLPENISYIDGEGDEAKQ